MFTRTVAAIKAAVGTGVHSAGPACPGKARGKQGALWPKKRADGEGERLP